MDTNDLNYLLENNPHYNKNYYKNASGINVSIQERYLRSSIFRYKTIKGDMRIRDKFKILDLDDTEMFELKELRYPNNGQYVRSFVENKLKAEDYLSRFSVNTPKSKVYHKNEMNIAKKESFRNADRVVIKPLSSSRGRGVQVNVSKEKFEINWKITKDALRKKNEYILVQNLVQGFEARATVIEGSLLSIIARVPPYVTGNGSDSIRELIEIKNEERLKCDFRKKMLIKTTESSKAFLESNNLDFDYIPGNNENILLNSVSNIAYGGETINITDLVCKDIKEAALNAVACIPNLNTCGIDIMMTSFDDNHPVILEINAYPFLSLPYFPTFGDGINPTKFYVEALVTMHQHVNKPNKRYFIEDENTYITNYLSFNERRKDMLDKNFKALIDLN